MLEHVYIVVRSMVSDGTHDIETDLFENEDDCVEFFKEKYGEMETAVRNEAKDLDIPVYTFWEMYRSKTSLPEKGTYMLLFDMAGNSKIITHTKDGAEQLSYKIEYYCKAVASHDTVEKMKADRPQ